jgi:hypothetical protein
MKSEPCNKAKHGEKPPDRRTLSLLAMAWRNNDQDKSRYFCSRSNAPSPATLGMLAAAPHLGCPNSGLIGTPNDVVVKR